MSMSAFIKRGFKSNVGFVDEMLLVEFIGSSFSLYK